MFNNHFEMARSVADGKLPPVFVYAVESAIQLTLTELNENLREIYIEAYTHSEAAEYISQHMAKRLHAIFGLYQSELAEYDFYILGLGSSGMMRGYMAKPCSEDFPLEKKLRAFLQLSLTGYCVPREEIEKVLAFIDLLDIRTIAQGIMQEGFRALEMRYAFSLSSPEPNSYS